MSRKHWAAKFSKQLGSHCYFSGLYFISEGVSYILFLGRIQE